ncbi:Cthe_2314 family HEPN domain-containing protein [Paenibacillus motobuensis]|uniref:Cthe-2314-like HEPN domain-containing protein n=1 Tax=Paenibacillus motobuensis TaxID=295324 RepID=A0ABP3I4G0_9BACL
MYDISFPTSEEMEQLRTLSTYFRFRDSDLIRPEFTALDEEFTEISTWARILAQRLKELNFSYIMASFYYQKNIPDEPYYDNLSNKYFPHFNEQQQWSNKAGFEYYSEVLLFKAFSALDTIAHIVSINYGIKMRKVSFNKNLIKKLQEIDPLRSNRLNTIIESDRFIEFKKLRNDSTHNISPGQIDSGITKYPNGLVVSSIGNYTPASKRYLTMTSLKDTVFEIVEIIKLN